jgi:MFS family permease
MAAMRQSVPEAAGAADDRLDPLVWKIAGVALFGALLAQLDATIVNVSLSNLAADLNSNLATIQWVTSGYLLALTLVLPLNGWLVDRIGAKALYLWCFSAFTLSSALCGFAWSAPSLIAFRVLQGFSGGLLAPMTQMMIARAAGKHMARVAGYMALPVLLAPVLGPIIAGAILQYASWRWLFLVNLPVGVIALLLVVLFLPSDRHETTQRNLDWFGLALLSPGLVLFLYGSERLNNLTGRGILVAGLVMMAAFLWIARQKGGWMLAPLGIGMMITNPFMGALTDRFGIRRVSAGGALLTLVGTAPLLYLAIHGLDLFVLVPALFLRGMAMIAVGLPSLTAAYASVSRQKMPMATTSLNIVQRLGGPTMTTLCASFLAWKLGSHVAGHSASTAYAWAFLLLCSLHAFTFLFAIRLPRRLDDVGIRK